MATMTEAEIEEFLEASRHAIVATNRADGAPQISPVWYIHEDRRLYITVGTASAKYRNLRRDPRVSVCIDGCHPDTRYVAITGTAELIEEVTPWFDDIRWRIFRRYRDSDEAADRYLESVRGRASGLIVVAPEKIITRVPE